MCKKWRIPTGLLVIAAVLGVVVLFLPPPARAADQNPAASAGPTEKEIASVEAISSVLRKAAQQVTPAVVHVHARGVLTQGEEGKKDKQDEKEKGDEKAKSKEERKREEELLEPFRRFFEKHGGPQGFKFPEDLKKYYRQHPPIPREGMGSGVIVDAKKGYVLTSRHVVEHAEPEGVTVRTADNRKLSVEWIRTDEKTDVAVLKVKFPEKLHEAKLGDSDKLEVGDWVLAIGSPFGPWLTKTVTFGIVSAKGRSGLSLDLDYQDFIQTDAAINPGNSGGPLVSLRGEVIGINTAIVVPSSGAQLPWAQRLPQNAGIGFSVPSNLIKWVMAQLIEHEKVVRGYLGVLIQGLEDQPGLAGTYGLKEDKGVIVNEVRGEPARKAGLKPDDVILSIDGKEVRNTKDLAGRVAMIRPGTKAKFGIWRDGKAKDLDVIIGEQPKDFTTRVSMRRPGVRYEKVKGGKIEALGVTVEPLTDRNGKKYGWKGEEGGLLITKVESGSDAEEFRLMPGDLILGVQRTPVNSVQDLRKMMNKKALAKGVRLVVKRFSTGATDNLFMRNR